MQNIEKRRLLDRISWPPVIIVGVIAILLALGDLSSSSVDTNDTNLGLTPSRAPTPEITPSRAPTPEITPDIRATEPAPGSDVLIVVTQAVRQAEVIPNAGPWVSSDGKVVSPYATAE